MKNLTEPSVYTFMALLAAALKQGGQSEISDDKALVARLRRLAEAHFDSSSSASLSDADWTCVVSLIELLRVTLEMEVDPTVSLPLPSLDPSEN